MHTVWVCRNAVFTVSFWKRIKRFNFCRENNLLWQLLSEAVSSPASFILNSVYLVILYHPDGSFARTCSARGTVGERVLTSLIGRRDKKETKMEEETRSAFFAFKRPFFFFFRLKKYDTPTHEQSSDIIVGKVQKILPSFHDFPFDVPLFRLITRIYEFLSQENELAKRIPRLYVPDTWIRAGFVCARSSTRKREGGWK